jgi:hypothetical protein
MCISSSAYGSARCRLSRHAPQLSAEYSVDLKKGLTSQQVLTQRQKFGKNSLTPPKVRPKW